MQISNLAGVSAFNSNLHTHSAKTLQNIPLPKFTGSLWTTNVVLTKTEATRSDEEILNDVIEVAKKCAQGIKGTTVPGHMPPSLKEEFNKLWGEYVSPYSPDRQAIFTKGLESTQNEIKSRISKPILDTSLLTILLGKNKVNASFWFSPNDKRTVEVDYMQFFDENGEQIGGYQRNLGGWNITLTEVERARISEVSALFRDTLNAEIANRSRETATNANSNVSYQQNQAAQTTTAQQAISRYEQMQNAGR